MPNVQTPLEFFILIPGAEVIAAEFLNLTSSSIRLPPFISTPEGALIEVNFTCCAIAPVSSTILTLNP